MKKVLFVSIATASLLSGCIFPTGIINGSDETTVVSKSHTGFTKVSVSNACEAVITKAEAFSVKVEVNENVEEYLNVTLVDGCLNIDLDNGHCYNHLTFKVSIGMPEIENVSCSDASIMTLSGFSSEKAFTAAVHDASKLNGSLNCGDIAVHVSDASEATLTGVGGDLECTVTDASKLKLRGMKCGNANVAIADASNAEIYVNGNLTGKVNDASRVTYYGHVVKGTLSVNDASKVVQGD